uniref:Uncharacterized protein n=1 Tax=Strongyloides venezuelensis TaxID=75913 RepID=A0A0K0G582_STRVS
MIEKKSKKTETDDDKTQFGGETSQPIKFHLTNSTKQNLLNLNKDQKLITNSKTIVSYQNELEWTRNLNKRMELSIISEITTSVYYSVTLIWRIKEVGIPERKTSKSLKRKRADSIRSYWLDIHL